MVNKFFLRDINKLRIMWSNHRHRIKWLNIRFQKVMDRHGPRPVAKVNASQSTMIRIATAGAP